MGYLDEEVQGPSTNAEVATWGQVAGGILDSEVFQLAVERVEQLFVIRWLEEESAESHVTCRAAIHALREVQRQLRSIASDGVVAEKDIEDAQK